MPADGSTASGADGQRPSAPDDGADAPTDGTTVPPPPPEEREDAPGEDKGDDTRDGETTPTPRTATGVDEEQDDDGGGCLIATAAYGTELAPHVQMLREVRDTTLGSTVAGTSFMAWFNDAYCAFSPAVADLEREHPALRQAVAMAAAPMLHSAAIVSLAGPGSEGQVVAYGALAIALMALAYVGVPAVAAAAVVRASRSRSCAWLFRKRRSPLGRSCRRAHCRA